MTAKSTVRRTCLMRWKKGITENC